MRDLIAEQRHRLILERLGVEGAVAVGKLSAALGVSRETIRRDLHVLARAGHLLKRHGGAISVAKTEPDEVQRSQTNAEGKRRIGLQAASMVPEGATVILDSGTTARCVADALIQRRDLTVITNDLGIARRMFRRQGIRVVLIGGTIQSHEEATLGPDAVDMLNRYHADFAFVGAGAITTDGHLSDFSRDAEALRSAMLQHARTACVIADHTKFGQVTPVRVVAFGRGHRLVTDRAPDRRLRERLARRGVQLIIAPE